MKKHIILFVLVLIIQANAVSQYCLPNGIVFSTQSEVESFRINYPSCSKILGNVRIYGTDITDLSNLNVITSIGGKLEVMANESLTSLTGLNNITSIGNGLEIMNNEVLTNLSGFESLDSIGSDFHVVGCNSLQDLTGMENLSFIGGSLITIRSNGNMVSLSGLENINKLSGSLKIQYNPYLSSLSGLWNLSSIGGQLTVSYNDTLTNLLGLESLMYTGGVNILNNGNLISLAGLESLDSIATTGLEISHNNKLSNLNGINNLRHIGSGLRILDNPKLASLSALYNLNYTRVITIGAQFWGNNSLESLTGLDNVNIDSLISVIIIGNTKLSTCEVKTVCDFLASSNGNIDIANNYQGCNNMQQVKQACLVGEFHHSINDIQISVFPNPATKDLNFSANATTISKVNIYNQYGEKVKTVYYPEKTIDISLITSGFYIVEVVTPKTIFKKKLIIE